jgi:hypothetical protein
LGARLDLLNQLLEAPPGAGQCDYLGLALGRGPPQVLLWSLSNRRFIGSLDAGGLWIPAIAIDDADQQLWVAGSDGRLLSYDLSRGGMTQLACGKANRELDAEEWRNLRPNDAYKGSCNTQ